MPQLGEDDDELFMEIEAATKSYSSFDKSPSEPLVKNSSLQNIVSATVAGTELEKLSVILYYTSDPKNTSNPSKQYKNSQDALNVLTNIGSTNSPAADPRLTIALHFSFRVYVVDINNTQKDKMFDKLGYKNIPLFVVVDEKGNILSKISGSFKAAKLYETLLKAGKKNDLSRKMKKEISIINELIKIEGLIESMNTKIRSKKGAEKEFFIKELNKLEEKLTNLEKEELLLWEK